jgi:hypothetical protein
MLYVGSINENSKILRSVFEKKKIEMCSPKIKRKNYCNLHLHSTMVTARQQPMWGHQEFMAAMLGPPKVPSGGYWLPEVHTGNHRAAGSSWHQWWGH